MAWFNISFTLPDSISGIAVDANAVIDDIAADSTSASGRLTAAEKPVYTKNALATAAGTIVHSVNDIVQQDIAIVYVHPWVNGLYQQGPIRGFISARNAVKACANKLPDRFDNQAFTEDIEVLVLVFSAGNYSLLAEALAAFNTVFYLPEMAMLERRCLQLVDHEKTRMEVPEPAIYPFYSQRSTQQFQAIKSASDLLHGHMAMVDAYADQNTNPDVELQDFITEKDAYVTELQDSYVAFSATFSGGAGSALFLPANSAFNQGQLLRQQADTLPEKPLAVALMMTGPENALALIKSVVGL
jgi:hypothetical protein